MGYLVGVGFLIAFSVAIGVVATILGLWLGQIILFDSIAMGIVAGVCCHHFAHVHTALSVLVGIGVCVLFFPCGWYLHVGVLCVIWIDRSCFNCRYNLGIGGIWIDPYNRCWTTPEGKRRKLITA